MTGSEKMTCESNGLEEKATFKGQSSWKKQVPPDHPQNKLHGALEAAIAETALPSQHSLFSLSQSQTFKKYVYEV